ncbi:PxORF111 peptide [Plutella xylostella granulovirus]|uniref:PxORF111 peptide n=1 Tax=Plutella xylostella granulovirus TaxID=98383 RepID=Q9DVS2_9BBAC|nr:PxORF111 peptide [Plutella xylostella granulovirus]AAG27409.1 PxORF111 peptide [Plutella xylostella granulovirus]
MSLRNVVYMLNGEGFAIERQNDGTAKLTPKNPSVNPDIGYVVLIEDHIDKFLNVLKQNYPNTVLLGHTKYDYSTVCSDAVIKKVISNHVDVKMKAITSLVVCACENFTIGSDGRLVFPQKTVFYVTIVEHLECVNDVIEAVHRKYGDNLTLLKRCFVPPIQHVPDSLKNHLLYKLFDDIFDCVDFKIKMLTF